jgi:hydrophobic/amphiphilic exporter-1 (mainly G- bacteria), HAE1 family
VTFSGTTQQGSQAFADITKAVAISIVLMYMLMMLLFRSVTLPLAVLISLPLAVIGALGAMTLTGTNFTLFSLLGVTLWSAWLVRMPFCWSTTPTRSENVD